MMLSLFAEARGVKNNKIMKMNAIIFLSVMYSFPVFVLNIERHSQKYSRYYVISKYIQTNLYIKYNEYE
jgi:hypothetical protein